MEDAHDLDRLFFHSIHHKVTSATTVSSNVKRAKTSHDFIPGLRAGDSGTLGELGYGLQ